MKKVVLLAILMMFMTWGVSYADYSFDFVGGGISVHGILGSPSNGIVSTGSVTVGGTQNDGLYSLVPAVPGGSIRPFRGTDLIFDDLFTPGSNPIMDGNGLVFAADNGLSDINIWGNGPDSYTLFFLSADSYGPTVNGTASASAVPEPATFLLFGGGLVGLAGYRMRSKKA